jgi:hypothetical protein
VDYGPWNPETSSGSSVSYDTGTGAVTLALSSAGGYTAWSRAVHDDTLAADREVAVTVDLNGSDEKFVSLHVRGDADWGGTNDQMVDGWRVMWAMGGTQQWVIYKRVAGVETAVVGPVTDTVNGTTCRVKVRMSGSTWYVKLWDTAGAEPALWSATFSDSALASQTRMAVSMNGGASAVAGRNVVFHTWSIGAPSTIPFEFAQRIGEAASTNATTPNTLTVTFPATERDKPMPGDLIVVRGARDNLASDPATGDSISATPGGETYTRVAVPQNVGTANAGLVQVTFFALVSTAWPQGANTLTWTMPTGPADRACYVEHFRHAGAQRGTADTSAGSTTSAVNILTTDPVAGDLVLGSGGFELNNASTVTPDSDTTNGSWSTMPTPVESASGGTAASRVKVFGQHKFVTATGNQSWGPTNSAAGDGAGSLITIQPGA